MCLLSSSNPSNSNSKKPSNSFKKLSSSPLSPSNSPKTLQILKNPFQKPGKFRDSSPRRTKERKKGKGSEKKDKPISTLRSHPTPSFFPREKRKGKKKNPSVRHAQPCPPPASKSSRHFERKTPVVSLEIDHRFRSRSSPSPRFPFPRLAPRESTSHPPSPLSSNSIRPRVIHDRPKVALD